jgi:hypothetical protein
MRDRLAAVEETIVVLRERVAGLPRREEFESLRKELLDQFAGLNRRLDGLADARKP